jgi:flagellar assembly factor FliW
MPKFKTVRFGELDYQQQDVIHLPDGLVGMPQLRNWLLLEMGDDIPMKWLQSIDRSDFGVPVSHAWLFQDDYEFDVPAASCRKLGNTQPANLTVLIITTIHPGGVLVTGNLMAPLVIDTETRQGLQLTLDDPRWSLRQEIDYCKFELAVTGQTPENAGQTAPTTLGTLRMTAGATEKVGA